jgi:hypothetical protein
MFQVRATAIGFAGDEEKYPCHFQHKKGVAKLDIYKKSLTPDEHEALKM